jgi:hypothetical protein
VAEFNASYFVYDVQTVKDLAASKTELCAVGGCPYASAGEMASV